MTFTSLGFIFIFLPLSVIIYFLIPDKKPEVRIWALILMSLIFYTWGDAKALPYLLVSVIVNWLTGIEIAYFRKKDQEKNAKIAVITGAIFDIAFLALCKYTGFGMPIGISFYTFSALSYIFDIYRKRTDENLSFRDGIFYMTFFPKLVSGPIVQFKDLKNQIESFKIDRDMILSGTSLFIMGMFKKLLIADQLGASFANIQGMEHKAALTAWLGMIFYSLQLYFDFSGYSDMAIGLARVFGFEFKKNFDYPYMSKNISEFWRRWHISLGAWFRDYVYIPLGGNRCDTKTHIRNLVAVWLLTGLWHGSTWNFVFWGVYHGAFVILEKYVIKDRADSLPDVLRILVTDLIVFIGWIFFFCPGLGSSFAWIGSLFGIGTNCFADGATFYSFYAGLPILIMAVLASTPFVYNIHEKIISKDDRRVAIAAVTLNVVLLLFCIAEMVGATYSSFLYFKF